jgi:hypothetical protein
MDLPELCSSRRRLKSVVRRHKIGQVRFRFVTCKRSAWPRPPSLRYGVASALATASPLLRQSRRSEAKADGGGGRTRTYEGVSQRIYSPPPLPLGTLPRTEAGAQHEGGPACGPLYGWRGPPSQSKTGRIAKAPTYWTQIALTLARRRSCAAFRCAGRFRPWSGRRSQYGAWRAACRTGGYRRDCGSGCP